MNDSGDKAARIERIRAIVTEDYERVMGTEDPYVILNLTSSSSWEEASSRYERYERFYRAENFQRLGDMDLTRKALDIRRAVGRAIVEVQSLFDSGGMSEISESTSNTGLLQVDPNAKALGDIYYEDGLTYLKLGDMDKAAECFATATDYDPTRGIVLAYRSYTSFRLRMNEPEVIADTRRNLYQASRMEPDNADILVLITRFHLKMKEKNEAEDTLKRIATMAPKHPKLKKLESSVAEL